MILKVAGQRIVDNDKLLEFIAKQSPESVVKVEYRRGEKHASVDVTLKPLPEDLRPRGRP